MASSASDARFSTHIACTADWQPVQWRHISADILYCLRLICSNWFVILVLCLVATPSAGQREQDAGDSTVLYTYRVSPRYLDQRQCLTLSRENLGNCNCSRPGKPPDIKQLMDEKNVRLPWERGTASPPAIETTTTLTSTLVMITEPTVRTTPSAVTDPHTPSVEATTTSLPSWTFKSTPPGEIDNPTPTGYANTGNAETDPVLLTFAIIIPMLTGILLVFGALYFLYKTQRGKRGRYQLQQTIRRWSKRNQSPSTTANGSANNQQSDIEINDVKASPHYKNGGTPAKCRHESEVTSDQEEGNVNSQMLKHSKSVPCGVPEDKRKSSCKTPHENRKPSRQIRLDSQSPLVSNMDESDITEDEEGDDGEETFGSNGHLEQQTENEILNDSMQDDDTFDSVDLKNGNLEGNIGLRNGENGKLEGSISLQNGDMVDEEMAKRNSSNSVTG